MCGISLPDQGREHSKHLWDLPGCDCGLEGSSLLLKRNVRVVCKLWMYVKYNNIWRKNCVYEIINDIQSVINALIFCILLSQMFKITIW